MNSALVQLIRTPTHDDLINWMGLTINYHRFTSHNSISLSASITTTNQSRSCTHVHVITLNNAHLFATHLILYLMPNGDIETGMIVCFALDWYDIINSNT